MDVNRLKPLHQGCLIRLGSISLSRLQMNNINEELLILKGSQQILLQQGWQCLATLTHNTLIQPLIKIYYLVILNLLVLKISQVFQFLWTRKPSKTSTTKDRFSLRILKYSNFNLIWIHSILQIIQTNRVDYTKSQINLALKFSHPYLQADPINHTQSTLSVIFSVNSITWWLMQWTDRCLPLILRIKQEHCNILLIGAIVRQFETIVVGY
jgi:hypothetical protein